MSQAEEARIYEDYEPVDDMTPPVTVVNIDGKWVERNTSYCPAPPEQGTQGWADGLAGLGAILLGVSFIALLVWIVVYTAMTLIGG